MVHRLVHSFHTQSMMPIAALAVLVMESFCDFVMCTRVEKTVEELRQLFGRALCDSSPTTCDDYARAAALSRQLQRVSHLSAH